MAEADPLRRFPDRREEVTREIAVVAPEWSRPPREEERLLISPPTTREHPDHAQRAWREPLALELKAAQPMALQELLPGRRRRVLPPVRARPERGRPEQRGPGASLLERRRGDAFAATGRALYLLCPLGVDWT